MMTIGIFVKPIREIQICVCVKFPMHL